MEVIEPKMSNRGEFFKGKERKWEKILVIVDKLNELREKYPRGENMG